MNTQRNICRKKTIYYISTEDGVCCPKTLPESNTLRLRNKKKKTHMHISPKYSNLLEKSFSTGVDEGGLSVFLFFLCCRRVRHFHSRSINFISSIYKSNITPAHNSPSASTASSCQRRWRRVLAGHYILCLLHWSSVYFRFRSTSILH